MINQELLRGIPKVDELLMDDALSAWPRAALVEVVREALEGLRQDILCERVTELPTTAALCAGINVRMHALTTGSLAPVINATGVILHTNLGRSRLSRTATAAAQVAAAQYTTLEYDLATGKRGRREAAVEELLCKITGAEAGMVVNNNAAATLLMLNHTACNRDVIISRGELVEIGGSFRIPEIMAQSGACLREIGTTNKTHVSDVTGAITEQTGALLKVQTSNFEIVGFAESVSLATMVEIGKYHNIPVLYDHGSGVLIDLSPYGMTEPTVQDSIQTGADIVAFSGDKLLGGPQAGILVGKKHLIEGMKRHPLARALRVDKMTLAALEATLMDYLDPAVALARIPTLQMITQPRNEILFKAQMLEHFLAEQGIAAEIVEERSEIGGGSAPMQTLPTQAVAVAHPSPDRLAQALRRQSPAVIARISKDRVLFDLRTVTRTECEVLCGAILRADCETKEENED